MRASGQPKGCLLRCVIPTQPSTNAGWECFRNHSNIVLCVLPGLVSRQLKKKKMQHLLKFFAPGVVKGTPDCILSWALGLGWKRSKSSKCRKMWRTGAGCSCLEATLTFLCFSPMCWLCIAFSNCSRPHGDQQINVHSSFDIFTSKGFNTSWQCFPLRYFTYNSKNSYFNCRKRKLFPPLPPLPFSSISSLFLKINCVLRQC